MRGVLGGHTKTCQDLVTGGKVDLGIIIFHVNNLFRKYFGRYQISLTTVGPVSGMRKYYNSRSGKILSTYLPPTPNFMVNAAQLAKYPYLKVGFNLPDLVPEDLLLSFGNFIQKYNIGDFVCFATVNVVQGVGDIFNLPMIYIFKAVKLFKSATLPLHVVITRNYTIKPLPSSIRTYYLCAVITYTYREKKLGGNLVDWWAQKP